MSYLLDTNVWIDCLKNPSGSNAAKLQTVRRREVVTCSIIRGELMHGAQKYGNRERRMALVEKTLAPFVSYSYDDQDAEVKLRFATSSRSQVTSSVLTICRLQRSQCAVS